LNRLWFPHTVCISNETKEEGQFVISRSGHGFKGQGHNLERETMISSQLYSQALSQVQAELIECNTTVKKTVKMLLKSPLLSPEYFSNAQIPLDLYCRRPGPRLFYLSKTCLRPGPQLFLSKTCHRLVCDQVPDFFLSLTCLRHVGDLFKTCQRPGFKQVLSKIDVMEFGQRHVCDFFCRRPGPRLFSAQNMSETWF